MQMSFVWVFIKFNNKYELKKSRLVLLFYLNRIEVVFLTTITTIAIIIVVFLTIMLYID